MTTITWTTARMMSLLLLVIATHAVAETSEVSIEQLLLMPGELTQGHQEIENECNECHESDNPSAQCLDCHEEINEDLINARRYHSTIEKAKIEQCRSCHTDHKGRTFDITSLDRDHFDHSRTEFTLKDSHLGLNCDLCHKPEDKNFRLESTSCNSCHDDPHQGELGEECADCHNEKVWKVNKFDHEETEFPLKGKHQDLVCQACHVDDVADPIGGMCVNCHLAKDVHFEVFGQKCESCHNEEEWQNNSYDHFKDANYRLNGKHQKLACVACHAKELNPSNKCNGCHSDNDVHHGSNGEQCQQCHNEKSWDKINFDHDKETDFNLLGAHQEVECDGCHLPGQTRADEERVRQCVDCHLPVDPHQGNLGKECQNCHQSKKWNEQVSFSHDFGDFPLTGAHQLLVCQACHFSADYAIESFRCIDCHAGDDNHQQTLGEECQTCHNSSSWTSWQFDHQQTNFALDGAHTDLMCDLCHTSQLPAPLTPPKRCVACHRQDDVHQGGFGDDCQRCHNTRRFDEFQY
ncbi:cytochrome c3 family protein [Thalassotalea sp. ND16A]|uniref:cytochrome c3 family protein n=1 Tax=Thalassotalea sp. ND16A TaxID=1535422 RepID=UPI00051D0C0F|nr:cytochrome c3 family protein [Thalassotalea sp. ND16A]KGJ95689.1 hypothetical protein ND16A_1224 [Thalassotalea sp. ND16A]